MICQSLVIHLSLHATYFTLLRIMSESSRPSGTILVVEDNDFIRMQLLKFLSEEGYSVIEARSGKQALDLYGSHITAIVSDVRMEPMGGFELLRKIQAGGSKTPAILVTSDQDPDMLSEATKLGISGVLMKPVQKARLIQMVNRAITTAQRASK